MNAKRYSEEGFNGFIKELLNNENFSNSTEGGIAKLVISEGFGALSDKQKYVFEKAISHYVYDECSRCGLEIPWSEMSAAEDNGGLCSWCQQLSRNDKD